MCNAANHKPGCRCGWGGEGHLGKSAGSLTIKKYLSKHNTGDFCAERPCPKCKMPVYFIRHNGGSLWVEELGWPWEKHGCFADFIIPSHLSGLHRRIPQIKNGIIVHSTNQKGGIGDYFVIKADCGNFYEVIIREGLDLKSLPGELVAFSVSNRKVYHPLIPLESIITIGLYNSPEIVRQTKLQQKGIVRPVLNAGVLQGNKINTIKDKQYYSDSDKDKMIIASIRGLLDRNPENRINNISKLIKFDDFRSLTPLTRRIFDAVPKVREHACMALKKNKCSDIVNKIEVLQKGKGLESQDNFKDIWLLIRDLLRQKDSSMPMNQQQGVFLVGHLRIFSLLPFLVSACDPNISIYTRRALAETLWRLSNPSIMPIALILSCDEDKIVKRYATAALAGQQNCTMASFLLNDKDETVRQQAKNSFEEIYSPELLPDPNRITDNPFEITEPCQFDDAVKYVNFNDILPFATRLIRQDDRACQTAGINALLSTDENKALLRFQKMEDDGDSTAMKAINDFFSVQKSEKSRKENMIDQIIERESSNAIHPVFKNMPRDKTVLIVGGCKITYGERYYFLRNDIDILNMIDSNREEKIIENINKSDLIVFLENDISYKTYYSVIRLNQESKNIPHANAQSQNALSISKAIIKSLK